jgi:undecaprenyl-diphosphatase
MGVLGVILPVASVVGAVVVVLSWRRGSLGPVDPEESERWLIRHSPPRLRRTMSAVDRRVIGGVGVAVALAVVFVAAVVVGWLFEAIDTNRGIARWDESAAEWGAANATERSTQAFEAVTDLGSTAVLAVALTVVACVDYARRRNPAVFVYLLVLGVGISLLNNGLKLVVDRDRPLIGQLVHPAGSSFPSGHSASAAACWAGMAFVLTRYSARRARILAAAGAIVVAMCVAGTRVTLGVHWVTDVMAGLVVGWTWFFLVSVVLGGRLLRPDVRPGQVGDGRPAEPPGTDRAARGRSELAR